MANGNGKILAHGLQKYFTKSDFYKDPMWKALVRQERDRITDASSYRERDRLARERAKKKYFLDEEPS